MLNATIYHVVDVVVVAPDDILTFSSKAFKFLLMFDSSLKTDVLPERLGNR